MNRGGTGSVLKGVNKVPVITLAWARTDQQQAVGLAGQVLLLAVLSAVADLGPVGWLAGLTYAVGFGLLLTAAAQRAAATTLGPAGLVTLARAVLVGCVTALVAHGLVTGAASTAVLVVLSTLALVLDAVDGWVARRTATATALGARFDMEVDAVLLLVLSVHVAGLLGPWVLAIGLMRYGFVAAGRELPWLAAPLPPRYSAKVVAAAQGIVLVAAASGALPQPLAGALVATALASLMWSFARDVGWLWSMTRPAELEPST